LEHPAILSHFGGRAVDDGRAAAGVRRGRRATSVAARAAKQSETSTGQHVSSILFVRADSTHHSSISSSIAVMVAASRTRAVQDAAGEMKIDGALPARIFELQFEVLVAFGAARHALDLDDVLKRPAVCKDLPARGLGKPGARVWRSLHSRGLKPQRQATILPIRYLPGILSETDTPGSAITEIAYRAN
jgi:hypothetical protein